MRGTIGDFITRLTLETKTPRLRFNKVTNFFIKKKIKEDIKYVTNKAKAIIRN